MQLFDKLFGRRKDEENFNNPANTKSNHQLYFEQKRIGLESVLGPMANQVMHAIIPFDVGGAVDMYFFTDHIQGTGFATMELLNCAGKFPKPNILGTYELVAFTKHDLKLSEGSSEPSNRIERRICGVFSSIGKFAYQATLNPGDTCEVPLSLEGNVCIILDHYQPLGKTFKIGNKLHHLLLCMEIFRSEMDFARKKGGVALLELLKTAGYYPYSDMDREKVV